MHPTRFHIRCWCLLAWGPCGTSQSHRTPQHPMLLSASSRGWRVHGSTLPPRLSQPLLAQERTVAQAACLRRKLRLSPPISIPSSSSETSDSSSLDTSCAARGGLPRLRRRRLRARRYLPAEAPSSRPRSQGAHSTVHRAGKTTHAQRSCSNWTRLVIAAIGAAPCATLLL